MSAGAGRVDEMPSKKTRAADDQDFHVISICLPRRTGVRRGKQMEIT
jgi:hypothetical protein